MPQVPQYNSGIQERALPGARVSANAPIEAFGGGRSSEAAFQSIGDLGSTIGKVAAKEKERADRTALEEAGAELIKRKNRRQLEAMAMKGKEAMKAESEIGQLYENDFNEISNNLNDSQQKTMFRSMYLKQSTELSTFNQTHAFKEMREYEKGVKMSAVEAARSDAVLNYGDPAKIADSMAMIAGTLGAYAQDEGMSEEQAGVMISKQISGTHTAIVNRMLSNGEDLLAKNYYESVKEQLTGQDISGIEKAVTEGSYRGESQRVTDGILSEGLTMTQSLEKTKDIEDPKLRDLVRDRVTSEFNLKKAAQREDRENMFTDSVNLLEGSAGNMDSIPPQTWAQFTLSERNGLKSYAKSLQTGDPVQTDWSKYYELKTLASSPETRDSFLKDTMMSYRHKLGDTEFKELINLQTSLRKGGDADTLLSGYRTSQGIVNDTLRKIDINPSSKDKKEAARVDLFRRRVDQEMIRYQEESGKKATSQDVQRIVDNLIVEGTVPGSGWIWDDDRRVFEISEDQAIEIEIDAIPTVERSKIKEALRRNGQPVTDQAIIELYNARIQGIIR